ncbi:MAG: shikimate kinase [Endomicrobiales bacterium]
MNIVLTGFMGTGKTAVAKILSDRLNWPLYDTDEIIEKEVGMKIPEIFARHGEKYFRELESRAVKLVSLQDQAIIACGGGVVLQKENMDDLEKHGVVICLTAAPEKILERTQSSERPLLAVKEPLTRIKELLYFREPFYRRCHMTLDTGCMGAEEVAEKIMNDPRVSSKR